MIRIYCCSDTFWNGRGCVTRDWLFPMENMSRWWWDWWLDFLWLRYLLEWYRQMICDWTLNLVSCGYVKETMTFGKTQNIFPCNGIWITDDFSWWFLKSMMASDIHIFLHILLLMMIRIFSGQLRNYLDLFFRCSKGTGKLYYNTLWYQYEALEGWEVWTDILCKCWHGI